MKRRIEEVIKQMLVWGILAFVLYIMYILGVGIPCPVKLATGLSCPSCGITRMSVHFLHGDFKKAFLYNQIMPFVIPILGIIFFIVGIRYIKTGEKELNKVENAIIIILIIVLVLYGIIRNLPCYIWKI